MKVTQMNVPSRPVPTVGSLEPGQTAIRNGELIMRCRIAGKLLENAAVATVGNEHRLGVVVPIVNLRTGSVWLADANEICSPVESLATWEPPKFITLNFG